MPYVHLLQSIDFLYANNKLLIWSIVEVGISIIATATATLRPLLVKSRLFRILQTSRNGNSSRPLGAATSGRSGMSERRSGLIPVSGGGGNSRRASGWFSQPTSSIAMSQEEQKGKPMSLEEGLWDSTAGQTSICVKAMESSAELTDLTVPKNGIQRTVKISSQSSQKE
jgi:hypothetical protein